MEIYIIELDTMAISINSFWPNVLTWGWLKYKNLIKHLNLG